MNTRLQKLIDHERSARSIGSVAEADAYLKKINLLKQLDAEKRLAQKVSGTWKCSCGFSISLNIDAGEFGQQLAEMQLAPHRRPGHELVEVKSK